MRKGRESMVHDENNKTQVLAIDRAFVGEGKSVKCTVQYLSAMVRLFTQFARLWEALSGA